MHVGWEQSNAGGLGPGHVRVQVNAEVNEELVATALELAEMRARGQRI